MADISILQKYFPNLTKQQQDQFARLFDLYKDWNEKINVISRKDIDNLYLHHVLHSLAIAKVIHFRPGTHILDVGTGGGFPGIPLAIMFPDSAFTLIDSIRKKVGVADAIAKAIGLENTEIFQRNAMEEKCKYDFVVSRAVSHIDDLVKWTKKNIAATPHNSLPNGILCLKGGDLSNELKKYAKRSDTWALSDMFEEDYFESKYVVYVQP